MSAGAYAAGTPVRGLVSVGVVALLAATAGLAFDGVFPFAALLPVVGLAAGAPCVLSVLLYGRLPLWGTVPVSMLGWLMAVSATLFRSEAWLGFLPGPAAVRAALLGVRDAGGRLLTTILPAAPDSTAVVLVSFLVWAAALAGAEIALRSRSVMLPALAALPVLAVAVVLGVAGAGSVVPYAAVFAGLTLLLGLVRAARSAGTLAAGVPLLACLVLAAVVAAPALPMAERPYDVRRLVEQPPPRPINGVSALDQVSAWLQNPQRELFTVATASEANLRLAVLDTFDGVTWTSGAGFVPTGGRVPGQEGGGDPVTQRFTLQKLPGPWLPAADRPLLVKGAGIVVDPATGMLAGTQAREGMTYEVTSGIRHYTAEDLRAAVPAADPAALRLPDGPDGRTPPQRARLLAIARRATAGAQSPTQRAARLAAYLRKHAVNDVNSPPGHGYRSVEFFLTESRRGTTEQFAASFALLARAIGLPSRIVVGFRPGTGSGSGSGSGSSGVRQVRGGDVLAWAEVEFEGIGWVPFYPTPSRTRSGGGGDVAEGAPKQAREIEQAINSDSSEPKPTPTAANRATPTPAPRPGGSSGPLVWAAVPAAVLLVYLLAVLVVPPLRRMRRRRAAVPAARVVGAWRQTVARLRVAGIPVPSDALTAGEVASLAESVLGPAAREPLTTLAGVANLATFGGAPVDEADADLAWRHFGGVDALVRQKVGLASRLAHRLSPRSLVG
ncbi:transglutaminaseTgpA domain-containing protein [Nonomuraea angiospora]|uniref:transglutaminaseTgpA domain-containing protein n=1 Tax=Nonomuraea angiospora TaxID=46172 RepID=UPI0037B6B84A